MGGFAEGVLGAVPFFGITHVFGGVGISKANANTIIGHTEGVEDEFNEVEAAGDLVGNLIFGTEEMCVILSKAANPGEAAEFAGLFPAINGAEFCKADG